MNLAKVSTAKSFLVGPILDADGVAKTDEVVGSIKVTKNGTVGSPNGSSTLTHNHAGKYVYAGNAGDFDTLGEVEFSLNNSTNDMQPVKFQVVPAAVYDALVAGTDKLEVDVAEISGDSTAANNLEAACDGTGYNVGGGQTVAASVTSGVTLAANQDVRNVSGSIADKTGYALTSGERESIGTAVWATTTRTLSSFGTLVADIATAVWGAVTRTITGGTVSTVSDKTGYSLATAPPTAAQIQTAIEAEGSKLALIDAALTAIKGGGWSTETLKAIKDAIDDIEVGGGGLDAQGVRDALKLAPSAGAPASGSIDEHLDTLVQGVSVASVGQEAIDAGSFAQDGIQVIRDAMKLAPSSGSPASGSVDAQVAAVKAQTDQLVFADSRVNANASVTLTEQDIEDIGDGVATVVSTNLGEQLDRIEGHTTLIGSGAVTYSGPVTATGDANISAGQAHVGTLALSWSIAEWTGPSVDGATAVFYLQNRNAYRRTATRTADHEFGATVTQSGTTVSVTVELEDDESAAIAPGDYQMQVVATVGDDDVLVLDGKATVTKVLMGA